MLAIQLERQDNAQTDMKAHQRKQDGGVTSDRTGGTQAGLAGSERKAVPLTTGVGLPQGAPDRTRAIVKSGLSKIPIWIMGTERW